MAAVFKLSGQNSKVRDVKVVAANWEYVADCSGQASSINDSELEGSQATTAALVRLGSVRAHAFGNVLRDGVHAVEFDGIFCTSMANLITGIGKANYRVDSGSTQTTNRALDVTDDAADTMFTQVGGILPRVGIDVLLNVEILESGKGDKDVIYWDSGADRYKLAQLNDLTGTTLLDTQTLQGALFTSGNTFPAGTTTLLTLAGVLFTSGNTFPAGSVAGALAGVLFTSGNTFFTGRVTGTIEGVLFTSGNAFPTGLIFN